MLQILWAATPTPTPTPIDDNLVTPGVVGFLVTLAVILATILLLVDMNRRTRRVRYRAEIAERLDAEEAAEAAARDDEAERP
ncbi:hypothetical protein [Protaetiibacter intestinalis]|uniref:hypothetical protein n=1 Tax=Protaetiibacter intestinalis TaxID=2419774 RepID=UPI001D0474F5|nr:hypothetical protein [Protaetiibacter intestinalis]